MSRRWTLFALGGASTLVVVPSSWARDDVPGLLFQGGTVVPPPIVAVDPALPVGHRARWVERPLGETRTGAGGVSGAKLPPPEQLSATRLSRQCARDMPVCVHGGTMASRLGALATLASAYRQWNYVLDMPAPLPDGAMGGGPELDLYLDSGQSASAGLEVYLDAPLLRAERASAWCHIGETRLSERIAALCVAEASLAGLDPAMGPGMRRGWASYQVDAAYPSDNDVLRSVDDAQRQPFRAPLTRDLHPHSEASSAFWAYLDRRLGVDGRGKLPLVMVHLSNSGTPPLIAHPEWRHTPDELDVLRHALSQDGSRISELWSEWATSRAFWGARADGAHAPELRSTGDAGRITFDWTLAYSSLPRHLAGPNPIQPLGAAYLWVELDSVPLHATLAFRAEWEEPTRFRWVIVAVDDQGREMNRRSLPYVENATSAETTLMNFEGSAGLVLVGINLGSVDVSHPFDPDQEPWEPHAYSVYLTQLSP
jgi:hypothetical protein